MKIVVGLGNPGKQYEKTRHNVGWMVLDRIADRAGLGGRVKARDASAVVIGRVEGLDLVLAKPTTYMNLSGVAVRKLLARERAPKSDMLVIVDDFALPLGKLRMRGEGSAGGHNGLRSIIAELGTQDFSRLRVGIGEPAQSSIDYVLSRFTPDEEKVLDEVLDAAADAVLAWARDGIDRTANRWNAWTPPSALGSPASAGSPKAAGSPRAAGSSTSAASSTSLGSSRADGSSNAPSSPEDAGSPPSFEADAAGDADRAPDLPAAGEVGGPAGADGIRRTSTGWRCLLPSTGHGRQAEPGDDWRPTGSGDKRSTGDGQRSTGSDDQRPPNDQRQPRQGDRETRR